MNKFEKERIRSNLVFMEKHLILDDDFLELSLQRRIFSRGTLDNIMRTDSPPLDYCMKLLRCDSSAYSQFIDILIGTKQNHIVDILLKTLPMDSM
jgi:hypothetical protein